MIGAIAGDMIGKPYERYPIKHKNFDPLVHGFTEIRSAQLAQNRRSPSKP
jgi:hypothetical protein